jgi:outer membrane protein
MRLLGFRGTRRQRLFFSASLALLAGAVPLRGRAAPATSAESPLTLAEVIATALRSHPQAASAHANADAAVARVGEARSAWLPQLNSVTSTNGNYSYQTGTNSDTPSAQTLRYSSQLQLSQLIYDFGRTGGNIDAAKAGARASINDDQTVQTQLALAAANSFYASLQSEALLEVAQRNLEQQHQRLAQSESFFKIGTRPEIDVLIARTAVAQAELQLAQTRTNVGVARTQLVQALGVPEPEWNSWLSRRLSTELAAPLPEEPMNLGPNNSAQVSDAVIDEVLRDRPDYRALRERLIQSEQQLRSTRGNYYPQLAVGATASVGGLINTLTIQGSAATTGLVQPIHGEPLLAVSGQATLIWPLLSGLNTVYSVREAEATVRAAKANLDAMRLQVRSVLLQVMVQVVTARESVHAAESLVKQAELQLQMATGRYRAGVGNAIELGDAQLAATTARGQMVQANYGLAMSRATLLWNLGRLAAAHSPSEPARPQASEQTR